MIRISVVDTWLTLRLASFNFPVSIMNRAESSFVTPFYQVALIDYGQVKDLPDQLRLGYAKLVLHIADGDATGVAETFR